MNTDKNCLPSLNTAFKAGGAPIIWKRVLKDILPEMQQIVPAGSRVLELGYGDGLLSIYLLRELGWQLKGIDIDSQAQARAVENARKFKLSDQIEFNCYSLHKIYEQKNRYDAVFIKTVLYNSKTLKEYEQWLNWILSVLKPGGTFINFETGRANNFTQWYRRARKRSYTDLCLYTGEVEALYDTRFEIVYRRYYGGWSQFFAPLSLLFRLAFPIEEAIKSRNADNCFVMAMIGKKRNA